MRDAEGEGGQSREGRTGQGELQSGDLGADGQTEHQRKQEGGWREPRPKGTRRVRTKGELRPCAAAGH